MAETLRELVVALSLDSSNFSRNMRTINQQIKEAESTFRLAGAGVENYPFTSKPASRSHRNGQPVHIDAGHSFTSTRVNRMGDRPVNIEK